MKNKKKELNFETTAEIKVSDRVIDQVIGQDKAVKIIKKASNQRRNVLLIGQPGTGKSMLGIAMSELMPKTQLTDILCLPNQKDKNQPRIKTVPAGTGRKIINSIPSTQSLLGGANSNNLMYISMIIAGILLVSQFLIPYLPSSIKDVFFPKESDVLEAANRIIFFFSIMILILIVALVNSVGKGLGQKMIKVLKPKILVDNDKKNKVPFIDATGAHEGALLGDVRHDPFQSGGLGTPAHERVEAGCIHKANRGVLFIDEIATLKPTSQIDLLTAMQEKKLSITGRSERSAGALVKTEPVPCDFVLVAAGNLDNKGRLQIHPALRSRIIGNGYEIYMDNMMEDNVENREKLAKFIAQEVKKEKGKIPHFNRSAVIEIIKEAQRKCGRKGKLTLKFRELGGIIRAAGDIAVEENAKVVTKRHVLKAKELSKTFFKQMAEKSIQNMKDYSLILNKGQEIGRVNGLAVLGASDVGLVMPIEAQVTLASRQGTNQIIATGKLGEIAKEAVQNVYAIIKKYKGNVKQNYDTHIQFVGSSSGTEGDSASITIAVAIISALEEIYIKQDLAMTGSLSVRGEVLPIGGVNAKLEAAIESGMKKIIVPKLNMQDIIPSLKQEKIKIIPVENISEVLEIALVAGKKKTELIKKIKKVLR